jgi:hypothetical protein
MECGFAAKQFYVWDRCYVDTGSGSPSVSGRVVWRNIFDRSGVDPGSNILGVASNASGRRFFALLRQWPTAKSRPDSNAPTETQYL